MTLGAAGVLVVSGASATPALASPFGPVQCKVTALYPDFADFFVGLLAQPPVVGGTIALDLAAPEIADLTFESGNAIPLARVHAKLARDTGASDEDYHVNYLGTYRSPATTPACWTPTSRTMPANLAVSIQILRHYFDGPRRSIPSRWTAPRVADGSCPARGLGTSARLPFGRRGTERDASRGPFLARQSPLWQPTRIIAMDRELTARGGFAARVGFSAPSADVSAIDEKSADGERRRRALLYRERNVLPLEPSVASDDAAEVAARRSTWRWWSDTSARGERSHS